MSNLPRVDRLVEILAKKDLDHIMIGPSPDMEYLTKIAPIIDERFKALVVSKDGRNFAIAPQICKDEFEEELLPDIPVYTWSDDTGPDAAIERAFGEYGLRDTVVALNDGIRAIDVLAMQRKYGLELADGDELVSLLRRAKSPEETECQKAVGALADEVLYEIEKFLKPGLTERDVWLKLRDEFERRGGEKISGIFASGPNGAMPHYTKYDRVIEKNDLVVIDFGGKYRGYRSDTTRTFVIGEPTEEQRKVYEIVLKAQKAGEAFVRPGIRACDLDRTVRGVIEEAGYGDYFTHRTGHGIGIIAHEPPYITATETTVLEEGMSFSIEPGIYLPGKFGVRIENCVVVTKDGCEAFTHYPRGLKVL